MRLQKKEILKKVLAKLNVLEKNNKKILIAKVIKKLARTETNPQILSSLLEDIKRIYQKNKNKDFDDLTLPKEVLRIIGNFMDKFILEQKDKLFILKEAKRSNFFDFTINKNLEKAWRLILKKWKLSHYRLEGGL